MSSWRKAGRKKRKRVRPVWRPPAGPLSHVAVVDGIGGHRSCYSSRSGEVPPRPTLSSSGPPVPLSPPPPEESGTFSDRRFFLDAVQEAVGVGGPVAAAAAVPQPLRPHLQIPTAAAPISATAVASALPLPYSPPPLPPSQSPELHLPVLRHSKAPAVERQLQQYLLRSSPLLRSPETRFCETGASSHRPHRLHQQLRLRHRRE